MKHAESKKLVYTGHHPWKNFAGIEFKSHVPTEVPFHTARKLVRTYPDQFEVIYEGPGLSLSLQEPEAIAVEIAPFVPAPVEPVVQPVEPVVQPDPLVQPVPAPVEVGPSDESTADA